MIKWGCVVILLFTVFAIFGDRGLGKLYQLRNLEGHLERQIALLEMGNKRLIRKIENLKDPKVLEMLIRDEMGYLRPDEIVFYREKPRGRR